MDEKVRWQFHLAFDCSLLWISDCAEISWYEKPCRCAPAVVTSNRKEFPGVEIWQFRKLQEEGQSLVASDHSAWFIGEGLSRYAQTGSDPLGSGREWRDPVWVLGGSTVIAAESNHRLTEAFTTCMFWHLSWRSLVIVATDRFHLHRIFTEAPHRLMERRKPISLKTDRLMILDIYLDRFFILPNE